MVVRRVAGTTRADEDVDRRRRRDRRVDEDDDDESTAANQRYTAGTVGR